MQTTAPNTLAPRRHAHARFRTLIGRLGRLALQRRGHYVSVSALRLCQPGGLCGCQTSVFARLLSGPPNGPFHRPQARAASQTAAHTFGASTCNPEEVVHSQRGRAWAPGVNGPMRCVACSRRSRASRRVLCSTCHLGCLDDAARASTFVMRHVSDVNAMMSPACPGYGRAQSPAALRDPVYAQPFQRELRERGAAFA